MSDQDRNTTTARVIKPARWDALANSLSGDLLRPTDDGYDKARRTFYSQFDSITPQAVALCEIPSDVADCLSFCRDNDLPATPRSGGHSLAGYSSTEGLVIDMSRLSHIQTRQTSAIGELTVTIGPGSRQVDTLTALWQHGLTLPQGAFPTVCAGGFLAGGGFGLTTRTHGMACDQLVSAQVVLADGRLVRCSESAEPDLFWALRGGGGGNFGIVTEYELCPQRLKELSTYLVTWLWDSAPAVLSAWQHWVINGPDQLGSALAILLPDATAGTAPSVVVSGAWIGDTGLDDELDAFVTAVGLPPETRTTEKLSYLDAILQGYGCVDKTPDQKQWVGHNPDAIISRQLHFIDRNRMVEEEIPESGIDEILTAFNADRQAGQSRFLTLFALGGQANRIPRTATAYVHRTTQFYLGYSVEVAGAPPNSEDQLAAALWADNGFAVADRYSCGESYQNFIDPRLEDWQQAYYAENYPRLVAVKHAYDPDGFFRFPQAIG